MSLTIKQKLYLLIVAGIIAITVIGGIGAKTAFQIFSSLESVNAYQDVTKGLADYKSIANESVLLAMDCIVDQKEGDISKERLALIDQLEASNEATYQFLLPYVGDAEWLPNAKQSVANLLIATKTDLRQLIIKLTTTQNSLNYELSGIQDRINKRGLFLGRLTDSVAQTFTARNALPSVQKKISSIKYAANKFSLVAMEMILKKDKGVSTDDLAILKAQIQTIRSNIDAIKELSVRSSERKICAAMHNTVMELETDGIKQLPSVVNEWTTTLKELENDFSAIDDTLDENGEAVMNVIQQQIDDATAHATKLTNESNDAFNSGLWASGITFGITAILLLGLGTAVIKGITSPLARTIRYADAIADGNLDAVITYGQQDEVGKLVSSIQNMVAMLKKLIAEADAMKQQADEKTELAEQALEQAKQANEQAEKAKREGIAEAASRLAAVVTHVTSSANELQKIVEDTSSQLGIQNSRLTETAVSMEQMHATVFDVSQNAASTSQNTQSAKDMATHGAGTVHKVTDGVTTVQSNFNMMQQGLNELNTHADGIGEIMGVITDIADQTNLLALNAAIEAARAGEAGRGFAVVADEVRKLAEKTMQATDEVGNAVNAIQSGTHNTVQGMNNTTTAVEEVTVLADEAGKNLNEIVSVVQTSSEQVASIAAAAEEQSAASEEINRAVSDVSRVSQEIVEAMQFAGNTLNTLAQQANELQNIISDLQNS
ncbi:methyl-accepting chemotaxis protein [Halodesulfovibrio spirochaetisodalis]|uniref:methyl-accepting chemotaxis protein n=1 Tax=Halodesulfovibrio spirochaetisodalis TaxID=1560234 RepID=UPI00083684B9|nr:methyl-accepting chemotaxis protein [Halodesulfovibrio spirochaetisodalis]